MKKVLFILLLSFAGPAFSQHGDFGIITYKMKVHGQPEVTGKLFFNDSASSYIFNKIGYDSIQRGRSSEMLRDKSGNMTISVMGPSATKAGTIIYRDYKKHRLLIPLQSTLYPFDDLSATGKQRNTHLPS